MRPAHLTVAIAFVVVASSRAAAEAAETDIRDLARGSSVIVVGVVTSVTGDGDNRDAQLRVENVFKGAVNARDLLTFAASPSWTCDISSAREGERLILFLDASPTRPGITSKRPTYAVARSGRGRILIDDHDGSPIAVLSGDVLVPASLNVTLAADLQIELPLETFVGEVRRCLATDEKSRAECDELDMVRAKRRTDYINVERPVLTRKWADGRAALSCRAYDEVALVESTAPTEMRSATIRRRASGTTAEVACSPSFTGKQLDVITRGPSILDGLHGRWLVLRGDSLHGNIVPFSVVDATTGREVFRANRLVDEGVGFDDFRTQGATAVYFALAFEIDCDPSDASCAASVRNKAGIAAEVPIDFDHAPCRGSRQTPVQAGITARVDDLRNPRLVLPGGPARCGPRAEP